MYKSNFVVAVKSDGKILREDKDTIGLPFSSHYSILLKNLNSVKAVVKVSIDGKDVLGGNSIIVQPNEETELKGFLEGSEVKNKFKFIQKTKQISDYRGDRIDDGLIRVEYTFEKVVREEIIKTTYTPKITYTCTYCGCWPCRCHVPYYHQPIWISSGTLCNDPNCDSNNAYYSANINDGASFTTCKNDAFVPNQDEGITVKGEEEKQNFSYGWVNELEETSNIVVLRLVGTSPIGKVITKLKTVKTKLTCPTCGKKSRSSCKYCSNCGTFLVEMEN